MLRNLLFKDFGWKLFSILLAGFIWVTVHKIIEEPETAGALTGTTRVTYTDLPVLVVASAADIHLYRVKPDKVTVIVSGPSDIMSVLRDNPVRVTVDLSKFDPAAAQSLPVDVSVPGGVTLVRVIPDRVEAIVPPKS